MGDSYVGWVLAVLFVTGGFVVALGMFWRRSPSSLYLTKRNPVLAALFCFGGLLIIYSDFLVYQAGVLPCFSGLWLDILGWGFFMGGFFAHCWKVVLDTSLTNARLSALGTFKSTQVAKERKSAESSSHTAALSNAGIMHSSVMDNSSSTSERPRRISVAMPAAGGDSTPITLTRGTTGTITPLAATTPESEARPTYPHVPGPEARPLPPTPVAESRTNPYPRVAVSAPSSGGPPELASAPRLGFGGDPHRRIHMSLPFMTLMRTPHAPHHQTVTTLPRPAARPPAQIKCTFIDKVLFGSQIFNVFSLVMLQVGSEASRAPTRLAPPQYGHCEGFPFETYYLYTWFALALLHMPYLIYRVKSIGTGLGLKRDLIFIAIYGAISLLSNIIMRILNHGQYSLQPSFSSSVAVFAIFVQSIVVPLVETIQRERLNLVLEQNRDVDSILRRPGVMDDFKAYAAKLFCVENVVFLEYYDTLLEVCHRHGDHSTKGKPLTSPVSDDLKAHFTSFFNTFIKTGSSMEVNIPHLLRETIESKFKSGLVTYDIFAAVHSHVLDLVRDNLLQGFIESKPASLARHTSTHTDRLSVTRAAHSSSSLSSSNESSSRTRSLHNGASPSTLANLSSPSSLAMPPTPSQETPVPEGNNMSHRTLPVNFHSAHGLSQHGPGDGHYFLSAQTMGRPRSLSPGMSTGGSPLVPGAERVPNSPLNFTALTLPRVVRSSMGSGSGALPAADSAGEVRGAPFPRSFSSASSSSTPAAAALAGRTLESPLNQSKGSSGGVGGSSGGGSGVGSGVVGSNAGSGVVGSNAGSGTAAAGSPPGKSPLRTLRPISARFEAGLRPESTSSLNEVQDGSVYELAVDVLSHQR